MVIHPVFFVLFGVLFVFCFILGLRLDAKVSAPRVSKLLSPVISEFDANRNRAFLGKHGDGREENTEFAFIDNPNGLFEKYLNQKALTKTILEKNHGNSENGENLLDRHKIAACVTVAIMKMRLLYLKYIDDKNNDYTLSKAKKVNEQLAFLSGLHVVFAFMAMEDSKRACPIFCVNNNLS